MKNIKISKKIIFVSLTICVFVSIVTYHIYQIMFNEWVYNYSQFIPLNNKTTYILRTNSTSNNFFSNYPEGVLYYLEPTSEKNSTLTPWGHWVIETNIPLDPFLNQEVYIKGKIAEGKILVRDLNLVATASSNVNEIFSTDFVGVKVESIVLANQSGAPTTSTSPH